MPHTCAWATAQKTRTLTTVSASLCRPCCSRPTETTSWKCRNNLPLIAVFELVENVLNGFRQVVFDAQPRFDTDQWGRNSDFIVSLSSTPHMSSVFVLVLLHKDNKLRSIYRNIKSQDEFIVRILRFFIVTLQMLRHAKSFAQRRYVATADVRPCPYTSLI